MRTRLDPATSEKPVSLEELQERVALIEQLLAETPDPFEGEFDRAFVRGRGQILAKWQETADPAFLLDLIGRGPGTTPAGDDTLIGLLAGVEILAAVAPALVLPLLQATHHIVQACPRFPTSFLSAQLLTSAAVGRLSEPLLELQKTLATREAVSGLVLSAARHILGAGHTTGRSALLGLVSPLSGRGLIALGRDCM